MNDQEGPGIFNQRAWSEGVPGAFKTFFVHHYPSFFGFAFSLLSDGQSARNVTTEAFFLLWKKRVDFDGEVNCKAFLFNTIRNHSLHYLKYLQQEPGTGGYMADKRGWPSLPPDALVEILAFAEGQEPPQVASEI